MGTASEEKELRAKARRLGELEAENEELKTALAKKPKALAKGDAKLAKDLEKAQARVAELEDSLKDAETARGQAVEENEKLKAELDAAAKADKKGKGK